MLRWAGFDQVSILDGGLKAWKSADLPLSTAHINRPEKTFPLALRPEVIADVSVVMVAIKDNKVELIDAMPAAHYAGQFHCMQDLDISPAPSAVAFSLFRLGHKDVAVYMGSLQEWTADSKNPMSIGDE